MNVLLAQPRGFCAGVVRAIEIVEQALERYDQPVYVVHEIVHNRRVVEDLEARGAIFVERVDQVPAGAVAIFSAHGVPDSVVEYAEEHRLAFIDATCPLVTKVHREVAAHAEAAREVILIGHEGHPEVIGTMGRYDTALGGAIHLVQDEDDARTVAPDNPRELAWVTQTTLSVDDTARIVEILKARFPEIRGPRKDDICYATQNRQNAVRSMTPDIDVLLVVGSRNSSNSNRLREVGKQMGIPAYLIQNAGGIDPSWVHEGTRVGVTAGASTPEVLVDDVLTTLGDMGANPVEHMDAEPERVTFRLPRVLTE